MCKLHYNVTQCDITMKLTTFIVIFLELPGEEVEKVAVEADREGHVGRGRGPLLLRHTLVQGNRRPDQAAVEKCCKMVRNW